MNLKSFLGKFYYWFFPQKQEVKSSKNLEEILFLKMKIAELESNIIKLSEIIHKTNQTVLLIQDNVENTQKISEQSFQLSKQHEDIFNKILEEKLLVFGLTKKTKVLKADKKDTKPE